MNVNRKPLARKGSSDATGKNATAKDLLPHPDSSMTGPSIDNAPHTPVSQAIAILVMGLTGAGKSTFISQLTQQDVEVGHSLESCTTIAMGYPIDGQNGQKIFLIDTPGFDDTHTDNAKVFREIASFLCTICNGQPLSIGGMIYVQRITDMRMAGSALQSLRIFEKICGNDCFQDVTIVTTMWSMLRTKEAKEAASVRENLLSKRSEFFGSLVVGGARLVRYQETHESALAIVELLAARQRKVILKLQKEMMTNDRVTLAETTAGRFLEGELANTRKRYEKEKKELEEYEYEVKEDVELMKSILEQKEDKAARIEQLDQGSLAVTRDDMRHEKREWFVKLHEELFSASGTEEKSAQVQQLEEKLQRSAMEKDRLRTENLAQSEELQEQNKKYEALKKERDEQLKREKAAKERIRKLPQLPFVQLLRGAFGNMASKEPGQPVRRSDSFPHDSKPPKRHAQKSSKKGPRSKGRQSGRSGSKSTSSHSRHHEATIAESQAYQEADISGIDDESDEEGTTSRTHSPTLGFSANTPIGPIPVNVVFDDSGLMRRVPTPPQYPTYSQIPRVT